MDKKEDDYFITFGCWNNGNVNDEKTALHHVMKKLNTFKPKYLFITGDNYYPTKTYIDDATFTKTIEHDMLESGFQSLPSGPGVEKYMLLGNHDVEPNKTYSIGKTHVEGESLSQKEDLDHCSILDKEIDVATKNDIRLTFNDVFTKIPNSLIIMIDTTMYIEPEAKGDMACYKKILQIDPNSEEGKITDGKKFNMYLQERQRKFVEDKIKNLGTDIQNIILMGHHPITGLKENKMVIPQTKFLDLLYDTIYKNTTDKSIKYYYLCADIHMYQEANITIRKKDPDSKMEIKQFVVGTGGAEFDSYADFYKSGFYKNVEDEGKEYSLHYVCNDMQKKNGFLKCNYNKDLTFKFIEASIHPSKVSKGGRKTMKRRKRKPRLTPFLFENAQRCNTHISLKRFQGGSPEKPHPQRFRFKMITPVENSPEQIEAREAARKEHQKQYLAQVNAKNTLKNQFKKTTMNRKTAKNPRLYTIAEKSKENSPDKSKENSPNTPTTTLSRKT